MALREPLRLAGVTAPRSSEEAGGDNITEQEKTAIQNAVAGTDPKLENNNTPNLTDQNANDQIANNKVNNKLDEIPLNKDAEIAETIDQQKQEDQLKDIEETQTELVDKINNENDPVQKTAESAGTSARFLQFRP